MCLIIKKKMKVKDRTIFSHIAFKCMFFKYFEINRKINTDVYQKSGAVLVQIQQGELTYYLVYIYKSNTPLPSRISEIFLRFVALQAVTRTFKIQD